MEQRAGALKNQAEPGRKEKPAAPAQGRTAPELPLLELQQAAGNRAVGRLLRSGMGGPADPPQGGLDEQKPAAPLRRLGAPAPHGPAQSKRDRDDAGATPQPILAQLRAAPGETAAGRHASDAQAARHALSRGAGQPLDPAARGFFEQSFGFDFSPVRVHHDSQAAESAQSLHALAYTYGHNIVFRNGHYAPDTREGRRLLGHELAHVVQQSGGEGRVQGAGLGRDAYETEADLAAARALAGRPVGPLTPVGSSLVQKDEPAAAVQAKKPQPGVRTPPPGGAYLHGKVNGAYVYVFNSEDALKAKDIWSVVVHHHLVKTFPGITQKVVKRVTREVKNKTVTGGWREAAEKYTAVGFTIAAELHATLVALVKERDKDAVPVEPAPGDFNVGDDGDPGGTGGGGGGKSTETEPGAEGGEGDRKPTRKEPETVNGMKVYFPPGLSQEEKDKLLLLLKEFLAPPDPSKDADAPSDFYVSERLQRLLLLIAESPQRAEILALVKRGDGSPLDRSLEDALETAVAEVKMAQAQKDFNLPTGEGENRPERRRPVRGEIVNLSKELIPKKLAKFMVNFHEMPVQTLRLPVAHIHWVAHKAGKRGEVVAKDFTGYIDLPPKGSIDHRVFDVTFTEPGTYTIVAAVQHNFYEANLFEATVEVIPEEQLTRQQNEEALKGFAQPGQTAPHSFYVGGLTGYTAGTVTRGDLDPKAVILTIEERLKTATDQKKQLEDLIAAYETIRTSDARQVVSWAKGYLETLKTSRGTLEAAQKEGGTALGVRGVFSSRTPEAPSRSLNLLCYFIRKAGDDRYHLYLHDFTQLTEPTEYRFSASEGTVEKAQEEVFIDQADAYPAGTLSVTFQGYDEAAHAPSNHYVRFEKVTDTVGKKIKAAVFDPYVDIAVNLATAVMMVVPGLQGLAIAIAIAYNTARTVAEMEEQANKGILTAGGVTLGAVQIGLNLIPLAGKGSKLVTIAGKTFHTVEAITVGTNVLLVGTQAMSEIERLRNGIVKELAEIEGQISAIEKVNLADPKLRELKKRRDRLIEEGKTEARKIFASTVFQQGLMMVGQHLITGYMARKYSLGQLKNQGAFRHEKDVKAYYDFKERVIVGDELKITPPELERLQLRHGQSSALEGHVPDPAQRQQIVEALGDRPVEVRAGTKTGLREEGGRAILEVAEGATPADIVAAAQGTKAPAPAATPDPSVAPPGAQPQASPPPAPEKAPAPPPAADTPAPAADKGADTPPATGQAEQAKQVVENVAEAKPAADKAETPAETPAPTQESAATPTHDKPDAAQPATDKGEVAPAKDAAEQSPEPKPAPEDDFKPVEPPEITKAGEKSKTDTPEGKPAEKPADTPGEKPADAEAKAKPADGAEAKPADGAEAKPADGAEAKPADGAEAKPADGAEAKPAEAKPAPDAEAKAAAAAAEAQAEAAALARAKIEADARALFRELKKKGYQRGMRTKERFTEDQFVDKHLNEGVYYDPADSHWHPRDPSKVRTPPAPVPAGTTTAAILDQLKGPSSTSTFKKFYETITGKGIATDAEVVAATDQVRADLKLDTTPSNIDKVRHAIKEKFKGKMLDAMFQKPDGTALTPAESHAKMRTLTTGLDSADKGPMTEEWQQRARRATTAREAVTAREAAAAAEAAAGKDAATSPEVAAARAAAAAKEGEAAAAANAAEQVVVKQTGAMKGDRQLDRVEGDTINEVKSGEGYLKEHDFDELDDHLALANAGDTIDVRGKPQKVTKVRWTFTSPEGASKNVSFLLEQMEANPTTFSVEVYNSAGVPKTFTWADVSGANAGKLHEYIGKPYGKK